MSNPPLKLLDFKKLPELTQEDAECLKKMESAQQAYIRNYKQSIDRALVERMVDLLGEVPSGEEMRKHGNCVVSPDGTLVFIWKGKPILTVPPIFTGTAPAHLS